MSRVLMGLQFFPRGGSAQVARSLARSLPHAGWDVRVVAGSTADADAGAFYDGLDIVPVDMTAALDAPDPVLASPPLHPSYEDRPGAPDRVFASLDDAAYAHQVDAWSQILADAGAADHDVLHLSHLTPLHAAAAQVAPDVPIVGHLHGTELLMLEEPDERWPHMAAWRNRMQAWAAGCARLVVPAHAQLARAEALLDIDADRCEVIPNGVDDAFFDPPAVDRTAFWRRHLVDAPRGWAPGGEPGSVGYAEADLRAFAEDAPVLLYVGRFTAVKRLPLLIEAFARAQACFARRAPLVILGGAPGEWEDEHPLEAIRRTGARDVFLAGWHPHEDLPAFLAAADAVVLPSVREQFGLVLAEGMAAGLPAVAVDAHGPAEIVCDGITGWLVAPDDVASLADALVAVVDDPAERARRGAAAREDAAERFGWPQLAERTAAIYAEAARPVAGRR